MKNVRSFEDFLLEGKQLFLGENIFIDAQPDGPVPFHYPGLAIDQDFGVVNRSQSDGSIR